MYQVPNLITMASASQTLAEGTSAIENGETEFSLVRLAGSDSSAMAVLLSWQRRARRHGTTLRFADVPPSVVSFASLYGVESFLPGFPVSGPLASPFPAENRAATVGHHRPT